jgi:Zn-finger protein
LKQIVSLIELVKEEDGIIWQYTSSGRFSIQSLYAIINDRGVKYVYTLVIWNISVPSRVHIFLWLLANNKTLTRDNLEKGKKLDDNRCLFCNELETVTHLFFKCCVARLVWNEIAEISGKVIGADFESVARFWVADKKMQSVECMFCYCPLSDLETKKRVLFSGRKMVRCAYSAKKNRKNVKEVEASKQRGCGYPGGLGAGTRSKKLQATKADVGTGK